MYVALTAATPQSGTGRKPQGKRAKPDAADCTFSACEACGGSATYSKHGWVTKWWGCSVRQDGFNSLDVEVAYPDGTGWNQTRLWNSDPLR